LIAGDRVLPRLDFKLYCPKMFNSNFHKCLTKLDGASNVTLAFPAWQRCEHGH
jgi:hypothetical protein